MGVEWEVACSFSLLPSSILATLVPLTVDSSSYDSPHTKAHLLLQAHFSRAPLPIVDYHTDTKSVLDQAIRILQVGRVTKVYVCQCSTILVDGDIDDDDDSGSGTGVGDEADVG